MYNEIENQKADITVEKGYNDWTMHRGMMTLNLDKFNISAPPGFVTVSQAEFESMQALAQQFLHDHPEEAMAIVNAISKKFGEDAFYEEEVSFYEDEVQEDGSIKRVRETKIVKKNKAMMMVNALKKDAQMKGSPLDALRDQGLMDDVDFDDPDNMDIPGFAHMSKAEKREAIRKKKQ